jgi:4'-phosphopantetheinyl transferase
LIAGDIDAPVAAAPGPREVHVWHAALPVPDDVIRACRDVLSADEGDRAARMLLAVPRDTFVVARGMLRGLASRYLGLPPRDLVFSYAAFGRPWLPPAVGRSPLQFSVSHSAGRIALAFTRDARVGIDIERMRATAECDAIAARFFAPAEQAALASLPAAERVAAFFACWTRKEALLKAIGLGISRGLNRVEVSCQPGEPARILRSESAEIVPAAWTMIDLAMPAPYRAALAVSMVEPAVTVAEAPAGVVLRA